MNSDLVVMIGSAAAGAFCCLLFLLLGAMLGAWLAMKFAEENADDEQGDNPSGVKLPPPPAVPPPPARQPMELHLTSQAIDAIAQRTALHMRAPFVSGRN